MSGGVEHEVVVSSEARKQPSRSSSRCSTAKGQYNNLMALSRLLWLVNIVEELQIIISLLFCCPLLRQPKYLAFQGYFVDPLPNV